MFDVLSMIYKNLDEFNYVNIGKIDHEDWEKIVEIVTKSLTYLDKEYSVDYKTEYEIIELL